MARKPRHLPVITETPQEIASETVNETAAPIETTEQTATPETAPAAQPEGDTLVVAEPTPKKKEAAKKPAKEPKAPRPLQGMMVSLKMLVFASPSLPIDDLVAQLKEEGFTPSRSSVATIKADFIHSVRVLDACGIKGLKSLLPK
jgi:cell division septation protein DedD